MITKKDFLKKYNILEASFEKTGLEWKDLVSIYDAYKKSIKTLEPSLNFFSERLRGAPRVHSIKARLKDAEHVIEKIIREKQNDTSLEITSDNYDKVVTDIIGIRALHLFKEDWESIHDWIMESWDVRAKPVVNIREGDKSELVELFEKKGCEVKKHPYGYRSAHYIVVSKPSKKQILAEIQVRTIFEEGWSEIDHLIRYPYVKDNPILGQYLVMFNRLSGSADEMGSYIMYLDTALKTREFEFSKAIEEKSKKNEELQGKIKDLESKIEKMKIEKKDRDFLKLGLGQISDITTSMPDFSKIGSSISDVSNISSLGVSSSISSSILDSSNFESLASRISKPLTGFGESISMSNNLGVDSFGEKLQSPTEKVETEENNRKNNEEKKEKSDGD